MINVAVLGFGVVGSGVAEVIRKNAGQISVKADNKIKLKYILDIREFPDSEFAPLFVKDFAVIENDPDVQVVVETIGGVGAALDFTRRAIKAGKNVVTSNKELVSEYGAELLESAREMNVNYLFEASVGGGIPVIHPISQCLTANKIHEITGILNGTTNYILTRMERGGMDFAGALKEAQRNGYAEQDPSADIEGYDACRKICILASLSFGRHVYPRQAPAEGITKVTVEDIRNARAAGFALKLLGRTVLRDDGTLIVYTAPHFVPSDNPLSNVEDVFNGIIVRGDVIGDVMFYGRGAGKLPTASAVVSDVIEAVKNIDSQKRLLWSGGDPSFVGDSEELQSRYYVRGGFDADTARKIFPDCQFAAHGGAIFTQPLTGHEFNKKAALLNQYGGMGISVRLFE